MLDLRLFRNRTFLGATVIVATLAGGSFGIFVYLSLFLLDVAGGSPVEVGLWLAPLALVAFATSLGAGRLAGQRAADRRAGGRHGRSPRAAWC